MYKGHLLIIKCFLVWFQIQFQPFVHRICPILHSNFFPTYNTLVYLLILITCFIIVLKNIKIVFIWVSFSHENGFAIIIYS